MGKYLVSWNNKVWEPLLNNYAVRKIAAFIHIPEVLLSILVVSVIVVFFANILRYRLRKKGFPVFFLCFGGFEYLYLYSVFLMLQQLPNIHHRLKRALQTIANIGQNYPKYTTIFEQEFGINTKKSGDIARCIYQLPAKDRILTDDFLFSHVYQALDEIIGSLARPVPIVGTVFFFITGIVLVFLIKGKKEKLRFFIQAAVLIFCSTQYVGMAIAGLICWIIGLALVGFLMEDTESQLSASQSDALE